MNTDEEPIAKKWRMTKERKARWLAKQSQESLDRIRAVDAAAYRSAKIVSECNRGDVVFLPRIELAPSDVNLPLVLKRRQFPLIPAYTMTIFKSQEQALGHVGIYLDEPAFSHGQLYVALSRSRNTNHVKIYTKTSEVQGKLLNNEKYFTQNVVYQDVFLNKEIRK
ncbi:hypothetical protein AVEN_41248-1 [Araneus ventricosus]|uniref:Uncharacterized protein n=1 Tax=Araneus ventricosus TaxID=182803 RepID=A0A4Y2WIC8_ARAVE|nr:hypothetical protein AVEN_273465-1 [Araneus ventricosus]GBO36973.1 hypothetical protein AVEN_41248-1 [Araneus ventricosus]